MLRVPIYRSLCVCVSVNYNAERSISQPNAFNNPTAQMVIDTQFVNVWGQLRTRKLHIMYSTPPQNPAKML